MLRHAARALALLSGLPIAAPAADLAAIDAYVAQKLADHLLPGVALVVVQEGKVVHHRGFGEMDAASPIVIGSLSKAVTATAVLQLVDAGRVDLDAPARSYLPEFDLADPASGAITVRQLLNQTSGLPANAPRADAADASLADHVAALRSARLVAPPGDRHLYSSPNYQVLGRLVEVVSGEPFGEYVQRHVFEPLQMTASAVEPGAAPGLAPGHNVWWGLRGPTAYRWEAGRLPTASIISTAGDLARFVLAHLGGGELDGARILSRQSVQAAHRGAAPAEGFSYAMGWREGTTAGLPSLWHGGALPCYRGAIVMLPQTRSGVVVLANSSTLFADPTREIAAGVVALLHGRPVPSGLPTQKRIYIGIAAGCALLLALGVRGLWRAARGPRLSSRRLMAGVGSDFGVPVALAVLLPRFAHVSWRGMLEGAPDIVVTATLLMGMSVASGVLKLARRSPPPPAAASRAPGVA